MVNKPEMGTLIMTKNDCYTRWEKNKERYSMNPSGIVVHSTGANNPNLKRYVNPDDGVLGKNTYGNYWNQPDFKKCVHGFIGKTADGRVMYYWTLPWECKAWGVGTGSKGSYNNTHIQFEMCEDGLTNEAYWNEVRKVAVHVCAWLCQEFGILTQNVVGHYEAAAAGYANNHGDPRNWMRKFGDSMDAFRADVVKLLQDEGGEIPMVHYKGKVQTRNSGYISIWNDVKKSKSLTRVNDGEWVEVLGANVSGTFAPATANGVVGYVDTQYLVDRVDIKDPEPGDPGTPEIPDGYILVKKSDLLEVLEAQRTAVDYIEDLLEEEE